MTSGLAVGGRHILTRSEVPGKGMVSCNIRCQPLLDVRQNSRASGPRAAHQVLTAFFELQVVPLKRGRQSEGDKQSHLAIQYMKEFRVHLTADFSVAGGFSDRNGRETSRRRCTRSSCRLAAAGSGLG